MLRSALSVKLVALAAVLAAISVVAGGFPWGPS